MALQANNEFNLSLTSAHHLGRVEDLSLCFTLRFEVRLEQSVEHLERENHRDAHGQEQRNVDRVPNDKIIII